MDFTFGPEQEAFRRELRTFGEKVLAPHYRSDDATAALRPELPAAMAGMGLTGLRIPARFGGQDADAVTTGTTAFEVSRADFNACYLLLNSALAADILLAAGVAAAALEDALEYARTREAFGKPIGRFQGLAFPLVECATHLRAATHLCYEALALKDAGLDPAIPANMAKWWAPRLAVEIVHQSLLTFGHAGFSTDNPQGQRMRDVIGLEIGDGTAQIAKLVVARQLLGRDFAP